MDWGSFESGLWTMVELLDWGLGTWDRRTEDWGLIRPEGG